MVDPTLLLPGLSPVDSKHVVARFDGGQLSSDGGVMVLREIEQRLKVAERLAACIDDTFDAVHSGQVDLIQAHRQHILDQAFLQTPERFVRKPPQPPTVPTAVWINPPKHHADSDQARPRTPQGTMPAKQA